MRQAIITKYHGPTNTRGSRISAKAAAGSITVPYEYGNNNPHAIAAATLARKLEWFGEWLAGGMPDGSGSCFAMREFKSNAERTKYREGKIVKVRT
jgi:hypothetical protein